MTSTSRYRTRLKAYAPRLRDLDADEVATCQWCRQERHDFRAWGDTEECVEIRSAWGRDMQARRVYPLTDPADLEYIRRVITSLEDDARAGAETKAARKREQAAARWRAKRARDRTIRETITP